MLLPFIVFGLQGMQNEFEKLLNAGFQQRNVKNASLLNICSLERYGSVSVDTLKKVVVNKLGAKQADGAVLINDVLHVYDGVEKKWREPFDARSDRLSKQIESCNVVLYYFQ